jgi:RNA polymerase sigma factor (sigma-70 family)
MSAKVMIRTTEQRPGAARSAPHSLACLVERARGGDESAWGEIVDRFAGLVWAVVRSYALEPADGLDAAQTTWLRLVEHLDRIREPEHLGAWLATTARRESLRLIQLRRREYPTEDLEEVDALEPEPLDGLIQAERKEALSLAVTSLSSRGQAVLRVLFSDEEPSYDQISARLGMPVGAIGPTRRRCLDQLQRHPLVRRLQG